MNPDEYLVEAQTNNQCFEWTGEMIKDPDGIIRPYEEFEDVHYNACRVLWFIATKKDPGEFEVLHTCGNECCMNIRHMYLGKGD